MQFIEEDNGEIIEDKLQNLEDYYIWKYIKLPLKYKTINLKYVFKVKYHINKIVARFKV